MTITPQDIQSKQFHVRLRGFDVEEVDGFLEKIAEEILILTLENKQTFEKIESLEKEIANYRNKEQTFQNAILSAQKISDEMQEKSRRTAEETVSQARNEAKQLLEKARSEAEGLRSRTAAETEDLKTSAREEAQRLISEAENSVRQLTGEINDLIGMKNSITSDLRRLLEGYLSRIDQEVPRELEDLVPLPGPNRAESSTEPLSPPEVEPEPSGATDRDEAEEDGELDDLHEHIDLPDGNDDLSQMSLPISPGELPAEPIDEPEMLDISDIEPLDLEEIDSGQPAFPAETKGEINETEADEITIPDLDGELLFSLDDPEDQPEASISISGDDQDQTRS